MKREKTTLRTDRVVWFLLVVSAAVYGIDYEIVGNGRDIFTGFLGNLAFLPIYVLFVTLMLERIIRERERTAIRQKLNMVIGVFFSEVGNGLLCEMPALLLRAAEVRERLQVGAEWGEKEFSRANDFIRDFSFDVDCTRVSLAEFKEFLTVKRGFMLSLLENPNLLEHDWFTDLLWAVFHLIEEMEARPSLENLPKADVEHLNGDIRRVYSCLLREWIFYMKHLRRHYPYLYSLAVRMNPLNPAAKAYMG